MLTSSEFITDTRTGLDAGRDGGGLRVLTTGDDAAFWQIWATGGGWAHPVAHVGATR